MELGSIDRERITHLVSIWHPDGATDEHIELVREAFPNALVHATVFDDIEYEHPGFQPATVEQVRAVLDFGAGVGPDDHLIVHCMAGISRSTACAIGILARHLDPGREREIAAFVRKIRPQAMPNRLVLAHADKLLARHGALLGACDEVFGAPSGEAETNKGWGNM